MSTNNPTRPTVGQIETMEKKQSIEQLFSEYTLEQQARLGVVYTLWHRKSYAPEYLEDVLSQIELATRDGKAKELAYRMLTNYC